MRYDNLNKLHILMSYSGLVNSNCGQYNMQVDIQKKIVVVKNNGGFPRLCSNEYYVRYSNILGLCRSHLL